MNSANASAPEKRFPDYSEWLVGDRLTHEEEVWTAAKVYNRNAGFLMEAAAAFNLGDSYTVLELGCGSGWIPTVLPDSVTYLGVDANSGVLDLAMQKNPPSSRRRFIKADFRSLPAIARVDLACSFAVLKHFGLHEWEDIFRIMLRSGRHGVFNVGVAFDSPLDCGTEWHYTWVAEGTVSRIVAEEGKSVARNMLIDIVPGLGNERIFCIQG